VPGVHLAKAKRHRPMPRRFPPPWSVEEQQACDADHRHYCCQGVRNQQL